jgi:hypothetical protein
VHVITDGAFPLEKFEDFPESIQWHFVGRAGNNQALSGLQLHEISPREYQAFVQLLNFSTEERVREVRVLVGGVEVNRTEISLPPASETPFSVTLLGNLEYVQLELLGSDVLAEDDYAGAGRLAEDVISVALVADRPDPLDRAIEAASHVVYEIIPTDSYDYSLNYDVTIFRDYIPGEWPDGLVLVVDPPAGAEILPVSGWQMITEPLEVYPSPITLGLDFSGVRWQGAWGISGWQDQFSTLIAAGDTPVLLETDLAQGKLLLFLPVLDAGNLTMHPVFPLFISNLLEMAREYSPDRSYLVGESVQFSHDPEGTEVTLIGPSGLEVPIPDSGRIELTQFGQYTFSRENPNGDHITGSFGVNAGDPEESNLRPHEWVEDYAGEEPDRPGRSTYEINLAPWLLSMVVVLLLLEAWRAWR